MKNQQLIDKLFEWNKDPALFVRQMFNVDIEDWQKEALAALVTHDRISIRSGHGVGKSALLSWIILWFLATRAEAKVPCTAPTAPQLKDILWAELRKWLMTMPPKFASLYKIVDDHLTFGNSFASARTARKENPDALQGFHAKNLLFVIDEAPGVEEVIFQVAEGALSGEGAKVIMAGNPTRTSGYFYDSHHRDKHNWWTRKVSCQESTRVSAKYIDDMKRKYGVDSDIYRYRVLGDFPVADSDTVIPLELIEAANHRDVEPLRRVMPVWGLDVARFGACRTALVKRWGNHVIEVQSWRKRDTMEVCGLVMQEYENADSDMRPAMICVDAIGLGAGVADRLQELGLPVSAVNVGEAPSGVGQYLNLRAELWWRAREWLEERDTRLDDQELAGELSIVKYQITSTGKIKIEGKEQMMERGVDSPDIADAFVLTFAGADRRREHDRYDRSERSRVSGWAA